MFPHGRQNYKTNSHLPSNTSPQMSRIMRGSAIPRPRLSLIVQDKGRQPGGMTLRSGALQMWGFEA